MSKESNVTRETVKNSITTTKASTFKKLSQEERKERMAKGLCFNYNDKFQPGHKCKGGIFMLYADESYLVEMEDQVELCNVEEPNVYTILNLGEGLSSIIYMLLKGK